MRTDPVRQGLRQGSFGIGIVGSAPDCQEELSEYDFAGEGVNEREPITVIDKQLFSGPVLLAHHVIQFASPAPVKITELGVLVPVRMSFFILDP